MVLAFIELACTTAVDTWRQRTFARKRDAQEWERRQVDGLCLGVCSDPGAAERPVQDWCDAWLAAQSPRAPATERKIREAINKRIAKTFGRRPQTKDS